MPLKELYSAYPKKQQNHLTLHITDDNEIVNPFPPNNMHNVYNKINLMKILWAFMSIIIDIIR